MDEGIQNSNETAPSQPRKRGPVKPEGWIEDPEERRRLVRQVSGSCPDFMTQDELQKLRSMS